MTSKSFFEGVVISYILPVWWMTSYFL